MSSIFSLLQDKRRERWMRNKIPPDKLASFFFFTGEYEGRSKNGEKKWRTNFSIKNEGELWLLKINNAYLFAFITVPTNLYYCHLNNALHYWHACRANNACSACRANNVCSACRAIEYQYIFFLTKSSHVECR